MIPKASCKATELAENQYLPLLKQPKPFPVAVRAKAYVCSIYRTVKSEWRQISDVKENEDINTNRKLYSEGCITTVLAILNLHK